MHQKTPNALSNGIGCLDMFRYTRVEARHSEGTSAANSDKILLGQTLWLHTSPLSLVAKNNSFAFFTFSANFR